MGRGGGVAGEGGGILSVDYFGKAGSESWTKKKSLYVYIYIYFLRCMLVIVFS